MQISAISLLANLISNYGVKRFTLARF